MLVWKAIRACLGACLLSLGIQNAPADTLDTIQNTLLNDACLLVDSYRFQVNPTHTDCWLTPQSTGQFPTEEFGRHQNLRQLRSVPPVLGASSGCPAESRLAVDESPSDWTELTGLPASLMPHTHKLFLRGWAITDAATDRIISSCIVAGQNARSMANQLTTSHSNLSRLQMDLAKIVVQSANSQVASENKSPFQNVSYDSKRDTEPSEFEASDSELNETKPSEIEPDESESELEGKVDQYWQYYEDCDFWDVIFAVLEPPQSQVIGMVSVENELTNRAIAFHFATAVSGRNVYPLLKFIGESIIQSGKQIYLGIDQQVFLFVESQSINWSRVDDRLISPLPGTVFLFLNCQSAKYGSLGSAATTGFQQTVQQVDQIFQTEIVPRITAAIVHNVEVQLVRERQRIQSQTQMARAIGNLGQSLVRWSEDRVDELQIKACELESQTRFADGRELNVVK